MQDVLIDERNKQIGDNVRKFRLLKGLTNEELCNGICSTSQLSKIENGKTYVQRDILKQFADRLETSIIRLESQDGLKDHLYEMIQDAKNAMGINKYQPAIDTLLVIIKIAEEFGYRDIFIESHVLLSRSLILTGQYTRAIFKLHDLIADDKSFSDPKYPMLLYYLGYAYQYNGDMSMAHYFYTKAYEDFESRDENISEEDQLQIVYAMAQSHGNLKNNRIALRYAEKAEFLATKLSRHLLKVRSKYMRGTLYSRLGEFEKADEYLLSALQEAKSNEFSLDIAIINHNIGELYQRRTDYAQAKRHFKYAKQLFESLNDHSRYTSTILQIAEISLLTSDLSDCINSIDIALAIVDNLDSDIYLNRPRALRLKGRLFLLQGQYDEYFDLLSEAMSIYESKKYYNDAYQIAAELAKECDKRNHPKTLDMYRKALQYNELQSQSGDDLG